MNRLFTWMKLLMMIGIFSASFMTQAAESYPFPQNVDYSFGLKPDGVSDADVTAAYNDWKSNFVTSSGACTGRRVIFDYFPGTGRGKEDKSRTVSEGIAYGMLIAAYMGDQSLLDDLWSFYKANRNGNGVMNWRIDNSCNATGQNGASDAELDVAMALIVASHQWQSDSYLNDAKSMIRIIREKEFEGDVLKPGDQFGGNSLVCPSYFSPAYYRVFAQHDTGYESFWTQAAAKGYDIIALAGGTSGFVPDWSTSSGTASGAAGEYEDQGKNFIFDAIRTPFRSGIDFLWFGHADAKEYCERISTTLINKHNSASDIGQKYASPLTGNGKQPGEKLINGANNTFLGCFGVGLMGTEMSSAQGFLNDIYSVNKSTNPSYGEYFNSSFKLLSMLVMTGNFYLPPPDQCDGPDLGVDRSLCEGSPLTLESNVADRSYQWKHNGTVLIGNQYSTQNITVSTAGNYEVVATDSEGCVRRDKIEVYDATPVADFTAVPGPGTIIINNTSLGGISDYAWEVTDPIGGKQNSTDISFSPSAPTEGQYTVELVVNNSGFGCTDSDTKTKTVIIGAGDGLALDDFNGLYDQGMVTYSYGAEDEPTPFGADPKTYCSADDVGGSKDCDDRRCSYLDIEAIGGSGAVNWASYVLAFNDGNVPGSGALDLSNSPFLSIDINASEAVAINIGLRDADGEEYAETVDLTTSSQTFVFDLSSVVGFDLANVASFHVWPYADDATFTGTISIDYAVFGSATLPKPSFDTRLDEFGYTDYSNYLPDFYPNDPQYADCTVETEGDACYGAVPDWDPEILACEGEATITAKACLANEIIWRSGNAIIGTGDEITVGPGVYYIDLINEGGVTTDSVTVTGGGETKAAFTAFIEDNGYGVRLLNNSEGFDAYEWDYDYTSTNPDLDGNETWEEGYMYYETERDYNICLTVTESTCMGEDTYCELITVECVQDPYSFTLTSSSHTVIPGALTDTIKTCGGVEVSVSADAGSPLEDITDYAAWYGFADSDEMSTTADVTFVPTDFSNYLKITTDSKCGDKIEDSIYIEVTPQVVAEVTHDPIKSLEGQTDNDAPLYNVFATTWAGEGATYKWYVNDVLVPTADGNEAHIDFFNYGKGSHTIKVETTGDCGTAENELVFEACSPEITPTFTTGDNYLEVQLFIDDYQSDYYDYSWVIEGEANPIAATSFEYAHTFAIAGDYDITLVANNGCADSESAVFTYTASENCTPNEADFTASVSGATVDLDIDAPNDGVTYTWTIESAPSTIEGETASYTFTETGVYEVSVTADNGCDVKESSQDVEVCVPVTDVSVGEITGSDEVLSSDAPVFYSVANIVGATYSWTTPSGWLVSGASTNELTVSTVGVSGDVSVSVTNACSSPVSKSLMVTTSEPISDIALTANQNGVEGGASSGGGISASVDYAGGNADDEIAWTVNGSPAGTGTTLDFPMDDANDVEVCVTISNGVTSSTQQCKTIDVKNNCATKLGAIGDITGVSEACEGTDVSLSLAAVTNAETYSWTSTTGSIVGTDNNATLSLGTTNTVVTVVIQSLNDCGSSEVTKTVSVINAPTAPANANFVASNEAGKTITFTAEDYKPEFDYAWSFTGGTPTSGTGETATTSFPTYDQSYDVTLTISGSPECSNYAGDTKTIPYELLECATPVDKSAEITLENKPCEALYGIYSVPTDANAKSYTWTLPSGSSIAQGDNTHQVVVNYGKVDGVISVEIEGLGTCEENSHTASLDLYVPSKNNAAFTSSVASEAVADLYDVTLTANQQSELLTYSWTIATDEKDAPVSPLGSGLSEEMESLALGTYEVCLTVSGGYCDSEEKSDCNPVFITVNGLYDELNDYTTNVYPTVASNEVIVELKGDLSGEYSINVLDMIGNTVATDAMRGGDVKVLNVSDLSSGMYLIQVSQGSQTFTRKIVKD